MLFRSLPGENQHRIGDQVGLHVPERAGVLVPAEDAPVAELAAVAAPSAAAAIAAGAERAP